MEEGTLAKWHVKKGDTVKSGDVIAEIETDKATMEVEAVDEGVIEDILVPEGTEGVKVNAPIAIIAAEGEDPASVQPRGGAPKAASDGAAKPEPKAEPSTADREHHARRRPHGLRAGERGARGRAAGRRRAG